MATAKEETKETLLSKLGADNIEALAKKIWLAGLGAYGRSFDEVQNRYEKANADSQKFFEELVKRGEKLQDDAESRLKDGRTTLEGRIEKLKKYATFSSNNEMNEKIDDVNRKLDVISRDLKKKAS
ncbi:phasin family protein [Pseudomaricurvus alkylphenolicus]|jgi:hypothetical protein|uniref:phasin-related domain-containing protein n=1 Tax=Pseudomaricurvus alkylphenolicus TaxID=1306991 RepID=UPI00141F7C10|nr:phasin family protein [Pseudomaricurvus alkylphenolicus]NIB40720.1 phasin family protein [Pseudomaricurvus alkylphenolicus]